jgi:hypothetical protein
VAYFILILKFFSGVILVFAFGAVIGHLIKLDKYYDDFYKDYNIDKFKDEDDQNQDIEKQGY